MHIFLLIGQSNMAGRGNLEDVKPIQHPQILMFRDGQWQQAKEPLHTDKPETAGIGLGMSFAEELLTDNPGTVVGLIPCAVGGTPLYRWIPGADLYQQAVATTNHAMQEGDQEGELKGILWHQGETDSSRLDDALSYGERLREMIVALRQEFQAPDCPVLAGELGDFLQDRAECKYFTIINSALYKLTEDLPMYRHISSFGLKHNGEFLHFAAASLREFGRRYARTYKAMTAANA